MGVSVVVIGWNERPEMDRHLEELSSLSVPERTELVAVVGGDDGTYEAYSEWCASQTSFDPVQCLEQRPSDGYVGAIQRGLRATRGELVLHLEMDTEIEPNWIEAMEAALEEDDAVTCKGRPRNGVSLHWAYQWIDQHRDLAEGRPQLSGAQTMGFRREVVENVLLEQPMAANTVDWDIYKRIIDAGYSTARTDETVVGVSHTVKRSSFGHFVKMQEIALAGSDGGWLTRQAVKFLAISVSPVLLAVFATLALFTQLPEAWLMAVPFGLVTAAVVAGDLDDVRIAARADRAGWLVGPLYVVSKQLLYVARIVVIVRLMTNGGRGGPVAQ